MRSLRISGWTSLWLGLMILSFVAVEVFGTNFINRGVQARLREEFVLTAQVREEALPEPEVTPTPEGSITWYPETQVTTGELMAVIRISSIGVDAVVLQGVGDEDLKKGPGHMEWTAYPGQPGNSVMSGHRTTYGAPFFALDRLEVGDLIEVDTALGTHTYAVREILVVQPTDMWVTQHRAGAWLTLTTCEPIGSARRRLVVVAELVAGANYAYVTNASA